MLTKGMSILRWLNEEQKIGKRDNEIWEKYEKEEKGEEKNRSQTIQFRKPTCSSSWSPKGPMSTPGLGRGTSSSRDTILKEESEVEPGCVEIMPRNLKVKLFYKSF